MLREKTRECGTSKPSEVSVSRRRKSSDMLNVADQLRKMSRLRPFTVCRAAGRGEIGDCEYNSVEEICYKWDQRKRKKCQRLFCLCLCYLSHLKNSIFVCSRE